jgi:hypothetical protein
LDEAGIVNHDYVVVVQWRAELENIDYLECAKHIVPTRDLKKRNKNGEKGITEDTKFIFMSSLNTDESVVWESTVWNNAIKTDVQIALHYLLDEHGFLKIDSLVA